MSVLYRIHRPKKWSDVIGQDHIVSVLESSIKLNRIAHAYLFSGSRGTGKTSIARIFAKALEVSDNDIYEIDAASNRGIDDIREIRDGVSVLPFESQYKVYIIDEAHMLTKEAFNALLKTLEEPPAHALFVLATTETEKIPETIASRCQVFSFRKPTREVLKSLVTKVAKKEGYSLEAGTAELIAVLGDGSFRDTLGILQKVISTSEDKSISMEEVERITGAPRGSLVNDFISSLAHKDKAGALKAITLAREANISMKTFAGLALEKARLVLLAKNSGPTQALDDVSEDDAILIKNLAGEKESALNSKALYELLRASDGIGKAYIESLPLELAVLAICE